jgi:hypothetical protein
VLWILQHPEMYMAIGESRSLVQNCLGADTVYLAKRLNTGTWRGFPGRTIDKSLIPSLHTG